MKNLIQAYNKNISKQLIAKTIDSYSWYRKELKKSIREFRGWLYEKDLK